MKTNLMQYLSLIYYITQPVHVSGICCPSSGGVHCICTAVGTVAFSPSQLPVNLTYNMYQLLYIYSVYLLMIGSKQS
jgi:hypothetical protein